MAAASRDAAAAREVLLGTSGCWLNHQWRLELVVSICTSAACPPVALPLLGPHLQAGNYIATAAANGDLVRVKSLLKSGSKIEASSGYVGASPSREG